MRCLTKSVPGRGFVAIPTLTLSPPLLSCVPGLLTVNSNQAWLGPTPDVVVPLDTVVTATRRNGWRKSLPSGIGGEVRNRLL